MVIYMSKNFYSVLGVEHDAPVEDIKKAYRRQLRLTHPDTGDVPDAKAFLEVQEAWATLSDAGKRAVYDQGLLGLTSIFADKEFYEAHFNFKVPDDSIVDDIKFSDNGETLSSSARKVQKETETRLAAEAEKSKQLIDVGIPSFPLGRFPIGKLISSSYQSAMSWDVSYEKVKHWKRNDNRLIRGWFIFAILVSAETFVLNVLLSKVDKTVAVLNWLLATLGLGILFTIVGLGFIFGVGIYRWARYSIIAHMPKTAPPKVF